MAGPFYPPPPVFIGGRQPHAPRDIVPHSGPTPQPPPLLAPIVAATFGVIISSWTPGPQLPQRAPNLIQSGPAVASQPPPPINLQGFIAQQWQDRVTTVVYAPQIAATSIAPQPTPSIALPYAIRAAWEPPPLPLQPPARLIQSGPLPSQPQPASVVTQLAIRATWDVIPSEAYYQGAGDIAPLIPPTTVAAGPAFASPYAQLISRLWTSDAPALPQTRANIAPLIPAAATAVQVPFSTQQSLIVSQWQDRTATVIYVPQFAAQSVPAQPAPIPTPSLVIRAAWDATLPSAYYQGAGRMAPLIPAAIITPPPSVSLPALLPPIIASWAPPQPPAQGYAAVAAWLPPATAPSQPPPSSFASMLSVIRAWDTPLWWPLPGLRLLPQSAPPALLQPSPLAALLPPIIAAWAAPQPPAQGFSSVASWLPAIAGPSAPPPASNATLLSVIRLWDAPVWWPLPSLALQPQSAPVVFQPSPLLVNQRTIRQAWEALTPPQLAALLVPQAQQSPPAPNASILRALLGSWDAGTPPAQRYPVVTASGPVPQPPPISSYAQLFALIKAWEPPVWWPLPSLVQQPQSDKGYQLYMVIMSQPGEDLLGGRIASNQYEIEYMTSQQALYSFETPAAFITDFAVPALMKLPLTYGSSVIIKSVAYTVLQTYMIDDGAFSRARLQT